VLGNHLPTNEGKKYVTGHHFYFFFCLKKSSVRTVTSLQVFWTAEWSKTHHGAINPSLTLSQDLPHSDTHNWSKLKSTRPFLTCFLTHRPGRQNSHQGYTHHPLCILWCCKKACNISLIPSPMHLKFLLFRCTFYPDLRWWHLFCIIIYRTILSNSAQRTVTRIVF